MVLFIVVSMDMRSMKVGSFHPFPTSREITSRPLKEGIESEVKSILEIWSIHTF